MAKSCPRLLYRYRRFDEYTLDSLCRDTLYFSNPANFNDPFDCKPELAADSSLAELRSLVKKMVARRVSSEMLKSLADAKVKGEKAKSHASKCGAQESARVLSNIAYNATNPDYECFEVEAERFLLTCGVPPFSVPRLMRVRVG